MAEDTQAAAPAGAASPDTPPQRGLTIDKAVALMAQRRASAAAAAPAATTPEPAAPPEPTAEDAETDTSDTEPGTADESVEADKPSDAEGDPHPADEDDPLLEAPDGTTIRLSELWKGHLRHQDYTRKTQVLAEERKALEAQRSSVEDKAREIETGLQAQLAQAQRAAEEAAAERKRYAESLELIANALSAEDKQWSEVDWDTLMESDPIEGQKRWIKYQRHLEAKRALETEKLDLTRKQEAEFTEVYQKARDRLYAHITAKHPDVADQANPAPMQAMIRTAKALGYSDAEIANSLDPRAFDMWRKATLYDQLIAKQKALAAAPDAPKPDATGRLRVVKAGAARPRTIPAPDAAVGRAMQALQRKGDIDSAVALMQARRAAAAARQGR